LAAPGTPARQNFPVPLPWTGPGGMLFTNRVHKKISTLLQKKVQGKRGKGKERLKFEVQNSEGRIQKSEEKRTVGF
jgi:hypothetical protein